MALQPKRPASAPIGVGRSVFAAHLTSRDVTDLSLPGPDGEVVSKAFAIERAIRCRGESFEDIMHRARTHGRTSAPTRKARPTSSSSSASAASSALGRKGTAPAACDHCADDSHPSADCPVLSGNRGDSGVRDAERGAAGAEDGVAGGARARARARARASEAASDGSISSASSPVSPVMSPGGGEESSQATPGSSRWWEEEEQQQRKARKEARLLRRQAASGGKKSRHEREEGAVLGGNGVSADAEGGEVGGEGGRGVEERGSSPLSPLSPLSPQWSPASAIPRMLLRKYTGTGSWRAAGGHESSFRIASGTVPGAARKGAVSSGTMVSRVRGGRLTRPSTALGRLEEERKEEESNENAVALGWMQVLEPQELRDLALDFRAGNTGVHWRPCASCDCGGHDAAEGLPSEELMADYKWSAGQEMLLSSKPYDVYLEQIDPRKDPGGIAAAINKAEAVVLATSLQSPSLLPKPPEPLTEHFVPSFSGYAAVFERGRPATPLRPRSSSPHSFASGRPASAAFSSTSSFSMSLDLGASARGGDDARTRGGGGGGGGRGALTHEEARREYIPRAGSLSAVMSGGAAPSHTRPPRPRRALAEVSRGAEEEVELAGRVDDLRGSTLSRLLKRGLLLPRSRPMSAQSMMTSSLCGSRPVSAASSGGDGGQKVADGETGSRQSTMSMLRSQVAAARAVVEQEKARMASGVGAGVGSGSLVNERTRQLLEEMKQLEDTEAWEQAAQRHALLLQVRQPHSPTLSD